MKKVALLLLAVSLLFVSCKKDDDTPDQVYRVVSLEYHATDSTVTSYTYKYENDKLVYISMRDNHIYFVRHLDYSTNDQILGIDSMIGDYVPTVSEIDYTLENGLITEISTENLNNNTASLTYTNGLLTEYIDRFATQPYQKKVYDYENNKLNTYFRYEYEDEEYVLWSKNEYEWEGSSLIRVQNYMVNIEPPDLRLTFKWEFEQEGGLPVKVVFYSKNISDEWIVVAEYNLNYDQNGYLEEITEKYAGYETFHSLITLRYEAGESNMSVFNKTAPEAIVLGDYLPPQFLFGNY
jgi:hypothetical protein